jgi:putative transposase
MKKTFQYRIYPTKKQQTTLNRWFAQQCAELAEVNAQVLQNVVKRVDLAFQAFFRGYATGERIGYPRYRSRARYDSRTSIGGHEPRHAMPGLVGTRKSACKPET